MLRRSDLFLKFLSMLGFMLGGVQAVGAQDCNRAMLRLMPSPTGETRRLCQPTDASCSVSSLLMALGRTRSSEDIEKFIASLDPLWRNRLLDGGDGVTLAQFEALVNLQVLEGMKLKAEAWHFLPSIEAREVWQLLKTRKNKNDIVLVNFDQSVVLGGARPVGHFSVVEELNPVSHEILIRDPDPDVPASYWVSIEKLLQAMSGLDASSQRTRGLLFIVRE
jgi:hypothetical protein